MTRSNQPLRKNKASFQENLLEGVRTAGAFLIGNSVLIMVGVADTHSGIAWLSLGSGICAVLVGSWTPTVARLRKEVKAAQGETSCVKLPEKINKDDN